MKYEFLAKSSGSVPYLVVFTHSENGLSATCNCKAGIFGKLCKHKLALLQGDASMLSDPTEDQKLYELSALVLKTSYPKFLSEIHQAELAQIKAKKTLDQSKKLLEKALKEGA